MDFTFPFGKSPFSEVIEYLSSCYCARGLTASALENRAFSEAVLKSGAIQEGFIDPVSFCALFFAQLNLFIILIRQPKNTLGNDVHLNFVRASVDSDCASV